MRLQHALFSAIVLLILNACVSAPQAPAPVVDVYTGKTFRDFKANQLSTETHTVNSGDTLYSIAFRAGKDYRELAQINNLDDSYTLRVGQVIKLTFDTKLVKNTTSKNSLSTSSKRKNNPTSNSGTTTKEGEKKAIASSEKQEYGRTSSYSSVNKTVTTKSQAYASRVTKWIWPASGELVTKFSASEQGSKGIDIAGQAGQQIVASADGKVVYAGDALRGFGKLVIVKHTDDYLSAYAHNKEILVKEQQWVKAGESVALMGNTDAPRTQLHFEIRYKGKSVDPLKYLPARS